ncbi:MAG: hypothetical protein WCO56_02585 [Verrucomicrobiota bacterium]
MQTRFHKHLFLVTAILFLVAAGFVQRSMDAHRQRLGILTTAPGLDGAPPMLAFTTMALGGFRGLIANALWLRANQMQEEDKFFEMVQLSDWITKLQPRMKQVWLMQAWNMAYNISVKFSDPEDRWRWVQRGFSLLRDEGLRYNPDEALIYRELGWIFQHKMGASLDDAHYTYKRHWIDEMTQVLGPQRDGYRELLSPKTDDARARAKLLREKYKMDPRRMAKADEEYGPLDWRLPEAHAVYWAMLGLEKCRPSELMPVRRVIYQSMQTSFQRGRLIMNRVNLPPMFGPNLDIIPQVNKAYEQMMAEDKENAPNIINGHKNFLRQAVFHLYVHNRMREAAAWFKVLCDKYPNDMWVTFCNRDLETYALQRIAEGAGETDDKKTTSFIEGYLRNAYMDLALDYDDRADGFLLMARKIYNNYMAKMTDTSQKVRVSLPDYAVINKTVLDNLLAPNTNVQAQAFQAVLRVKLGLPAATNAPPVTPK